MFRIALSDNIFLHFLGQVFANTKKIDIPIIIKKTNSTKNKFYKKQILQKQILQRDSNFNNYYTERKVNTLTSHNKGITTKTFSSLIHSYATMRRDTIFSSGTKELIEQSDSDLHHT